MKIAVCGNAPEGVIRKIQSVMKCNVVVAKQSNDHPIVDVAMETYGHNDEKCVLFANCALSFLVGVKDDDLFDVYEQIALSSLANLDRVYITTGMMNDKSVEIYRGYKEMFPDKIKIIVDENDIEL